MQEGSISAKHTTTINAAPNQWHTLSTTYIDIYPANFAKRNFHSCRLAHKTAQNLLLKNVLYARLTALTEISEICVGSFKGLRWFLPFLLPLLRSVLLSPLFSTCCLLRSAPFLL